MTDDERLVPLGELVTTHGLNGWLKLQPFNLRTTALCPAAAVVLELHGTRVALEIENCRPQKHQLLIKLREVNSVDDAGRWVGATLAMRESQLPPLEAGEYYQYQVIGFEVVHINGKKIGTVLATLSTPGGDLYVVRGAEKEHLIPAVSKIVEVVDFAAGKMVINPPDGLLDL